MAAERAARPRHVLRRGEADDPRDPPEGGDRARRQLPGRGDGAGRDRSAQLRTPRIGLFDTYGNNNMPSGWTRLILENFEFPYERVFPPDLDRGGLRDKYDVIVFNGAGLQARRRRTRRWTRGGAGGDAPAGGDAAAAPARLQAERGAGGGRGAGAQAPAGRAGFTPQPIPEEFARRQGQVSARRRSRRSSSSSRTAAP